MKDKELKRGIKEKDTTQIFHKFICILTTEFYAGEALIVYQIRINMLR